MTLLDSVLRDSPPFREIAACVQSLSPEEQAGLRVETVRRLTAGELPWAEARAILSIVGAEPLVPELVPLLRSGQASVEARAAALLVLQGTTFDLAPDLQSIDGPMALKITDRVLLMQQAADRAALEGTPFEELAGLHPEEDDIDEAVEAVVALFLASSEAAEAADREELQFWVRELVHLGVAYGYGTPALWNAGVLETLLTGILPRKVTVDSADEARPAVPAFRLFFRWAAGVAYVPYADAIDGMLRELEPDFPSMLVDESRFGLAKSFVNAGRTAGFDMATEEGLLAFQRQWNAERALPLLPSAKKKKDAAARKAKMAKLSRRKNRRRK